MITDHDRRRALRHLARVHDVPAPVVVTRSTGARTKVTITTREYPARAYAVALARLARRLAYVPDPLESATLV